jgi:hypothetical protein
MPALRPERAHRGSRLARTFSLLINLLLPPDAVRKVGKRSAGDQGKEGQDQEEFGCHSALSG